MVSVLINEQIRCALIVIEDIEKPNEYHPEADKVRPDIHCLIVALEYRPQGPRPVFIPNTIACANVLIISMVFRCILSIAYIGPYLPVAKRRRHVCRGGVILGTLVVFQVTTCGIHESIL